MAKNTKHLTGLLALTAVLLLTSFLPIASVSMTPAASAQTNAPRLVTVPDVDAGWLLVGDTSQWLSPDCRRVLEREVQQFETVEWNVLAGTTDPAVWRSCEQVSEYYRDHHRMPTPNPTPPTPNGSGAWLVTIPGNSAGWLLLNGTGQWLFPQCRNTLERRGAEFEVVRWSQIAETNRGPQQRSCDEVGDLYFGTTPTPTPTTPPGGTGDANLERGINFAGDFEVTPRRSWGTPIEDFFFPLVADAGFDHVRIPIRWSAYTGPAPAYRIQESFFAEVDQLVNLAQAEGLSIVLDVHFFEELDDNPWGERDHYLAIWRQIAERYQDQPGSVVFELLNEPVGVFNTQPEVWNRLAADALAVVRRTNPTRTVIIGPVSYNHASRLPDLELPDDPNVMATIHTYDPIEFTHQGAVFVDPMYPTGVTWRPNEGTVALNWLDRSWGTNVTSQTGGIRVDFEQQWGALAMIPDGAGQRYDELVISANRATEVLVLCNYLDGATITLPVNFNGNGDARVDVSSCGQIDSIALQASAANSNTVTLDRLALCAATCNEMVVTQYNALDQMISTAADWAADQGVGLYIGEFGVLSPQNDPTDQASRTAWTRALRTIAEENGAGWAYFELSGEFGAYDQATGQWNNSMLDALLR